MGDPVGRACITPTSELRYLMCSDGIRLVVDKNRFDEMFVFLSINFGTFRQRVESAATGSTRKRIGLNTLRQLPLEIPDRAEQQKIADCLSSLDGLIAAEGRKLEALKAHKKGLMQQLFPQPGQTRPRLRFPEFRDKGDWETIILGDVVSISKGKGIAKSDVGVGGTTPCIRYAELYTIYGEVITHIHSYTDEPVDTLVLSQAGDVIIPASGETKEEIATCGCVMNAGVALGSDLNVLRSDIDGRFFSYYLNGVQRSELAKVAQGDTVAHLYPAQISRLSICIAEEPAEQQKIASCLTTLNTRITAQAEKIDALKTHKRGLMQQLFPSLKELET